MRIGNLRQNTAPMMKPNSTPSRRAKQIRNVGIADLRNYRLPLPGVVSILHRLSGVLMFLALPFVLCLFDRSLRSADAYDTMVRFLHGWFIRLVLLALAWAVLHHACAGVRFLLLDVHIGTERAAARSSANIVLVISLALTFVFALALFGVL
jgi:succinate dehydrogenase / fumarate reductase cytochrome b subunit